jgi:hypothetical protein
VWALLEWHLQFVCLPGCLILFGATHLLLPESQIGPGTGAFHLNRARQCKVVGTTSVAKTYIMHVDCHAMRDALAQRDMPCMPSGEWCVQRSSYLESIM